MPRTGPRRPLLGVKVAEDEIKRIDTLAKAAGVSRSEVARVGIAYALRHLDQEGLVKILAEAREAGEPATNAEYLERLAITQAALVEDASRLATERGRAATPRP